MPALDFPNTPTIGQQYTAGIQSWEWDGISWNIVPTEITGGAAIFVGPGAPSAPTDGELWWDNDDPTVDFAGVVVGSSAPPAPVNGELWWDTSDVSLLPPQDLNIVAVNAAFTSRYVSIFKPLYAQIVTPATGITTQIDVGGLTVTTPVLAANRRLKITAQWLTNGTTSGSTLTMTIMEAATTLQLIQGVWSPPNNIVQTGIAIVTPTAAAHTYKLQASAGAGTMTVNASAMTPAFILVEDIGPAT